MSTTQETKRYSVATVGTIYFAGNSLRPRKDRVVRIETWAGLSEDEKRRVRTIEYWRTDADFAAREYVRYTTNETKGSRVTDRACFEATRFYTHDDMIDTYLANGGA
jgi:hypothetical protein